MGDGDLENVYTVDITINSINDAPTFVTLSNDLDSAIEGEEYSYLIE